MSIPEGFKIVPVEPTEEMRKAIFGLLSAYDDGSDITPSFFMKMLINAAPTPPQPIYDEAKELADCRASWEKTGVGVVFADYLAGWQSRAKSVEVGDE